MKYKMFSYLLLFSIFFIFTNNFLSFAGGIGYSNDMLLYLSTIPAGLIMFIMKISSLMDVDKKYVKFILFHNYSYVLFISLFWFFINIWVVGYNLGLGFSSDEIITLSSLSTIYGFSIFFITFTSLRSISSFKSK